MPSRRNNIHNMLSVCRKVTPWANVRKFGMAGLIGYVIALTAVGRHREAGFGVSRHPSKLVEKMVFSQLSALMTENKSDSNCRLDSASSTLLNPRCWRCSLTCSMGLTKATLHSSLCLTSVQPLTRSTTPSCCNDCRRRSASLAWPRTGSGRSSLAASRWSSLLVTLQQRPGTVRGPPRFGPGSCAVSMSCTPLISSSLWSLFRPASNSTLTTKIQDVY